MNGANNKETMRDTMGTSVNNTFQLMIFMIGDYERYEDQRIIEKPHTDKCE
jgi:hypothetical protein